MQAESMEIVHQPSRRLRTFIAQDERLIEEALRLRYRVFAQEMGARLQTKVPGLDVDDIDEHCAHLVVCDQKAGRVVGCTRLLSCAQAARLGHFYSEAEFDLDGVLALPGRFLEVGRTCVDPTYRGGMVIGALWSGLAEYVGGHGFDYLMGCASISPGPSGFAVDAVNRQLAAEHRAPESLRVTPKHPVPSHKRCARDESGIPPLLQAYLRLGAWVCGEPCWDRDFDVMDLFILLPVERMATRYERHFIGLRENGRDPLATVL